MSELKLTEADHSSSQDKNFSVTRIPSSEIGRVKNIQGKEEDSETIFDSQILEEVSSSQSMSEK